MDTQIEFYDKDVIKNILGVISLRPEKVVFIYDKELKDMTVFHGLMKCYQKRVPNMILEKYPVDILDIDNIYQKLSEVMERNEHCVIDLTGGSELMTIAGFKAGSEKNVEMIYTDIIQGRIMDIRDKNHVRKAQRLTLEDFIDAKGACLIGNSHVVPPQERFEDILAMCRILFEHIKQWKETCGFIQVAMANTSAHELHLCTKWSKRFMPSEDLLYAFQRFGFIKNLELTKAHIRFDFTTERAKQYLINYGVWLELFVYINAKKSGRFDDVLLGAMIDWNAYDGITVAGNEIDVILSENSLPVFISCKLRDVDTAAINELVIAKKRLGGWFSKSIIVSFGNDKRNKTGTYKRAQEMGVEILDKSDILSEDFSQRLVDTIRGHDLVSLKWKKV